MQKVTAMHGKLHTPNQWKSDRCRTLEPQSLLSSFKDTGSRWGSEPVKGGHLLWSEFTNQRQVSGYPDDCNSPSA